MTQNIGLSSGTHSPCFLLSCTSFREPMFRLPRKVTEFPAHSLAGSGNLSKPCPFRVIVSRQC